MRVRVCGCRRSNNENTAHVFGAGEALRVRLAGLSLLALDLDREGTWSRALDTVGDMNAGRSLFGVLAGEKAMESRDEEHG